MIDDGKIRISCLKDDRGSAVRRSYSITLSARAAIVGRDRDAQCLCRLDVEGEFEQRRLDRREVSRLFIAPDCDKGMEMERLDAAGLRQVAGDALDLALIATAQFYDVAIGVAHDHRNVAASLKLTDPWLIAISLAFSAAIVTEIVRGTVEFQVAAFGSASSAWQKFYRL